MPSQPYIPFYVGDWKKSADVQSLPYHERGIWFEMLCTMHNSHKRGELSLPSGDAMADDEIARLLGLSPQVFTNALAVLIRSGVTERNENGAIINRRMVRERLKSEAKQRAGKAGADTRWGSKALAEAWHRIDNENGSLSSGSLEDKKRLRSTLEQWQEYRQHRAEPPKDWSLYWDKQLKFLSHYTPRVAIEIIDASIRNNWQGLFPPKNGSTPHDAPAAAVPIFAKIKAVEAQISEAEKQLRAIPNSAPSVFPERAEAEEKRRKPLREQKAKLNAQLLALRRQQSE